MAIETALFSDGEIDRSCRISFSRGSAIVWSNSSFLLAAAQCGVVSIERRHT